LPGILLTGTLVVTLLYVGLNFIFLYAAPIAELQGQIEVGVIAAKAAFGDLGGRFAGLVFSLLLISTVSAMTMAGPRVLQVIGEDFRAFRFPAKTNQDGIPSTAIYIQATLSVLFVVTSSFESVLLFAGFTLALNSFATVLSLFVLRWRQPDIERPYRTFLYPLPPLIYLSLTGWTLWFVLVNRPVEGLFGIGVIGSGLLVYWLLRDKHKT
jgi:APA family basic amino acid/polyamine antiporter